VYRTVNLFGPLGALGCSKIFMTGLKVRLIVERRAVDSSMQYLPLNWRVMIAGSNIFNSCLGKNTSESDSMDISMKDIADIKAGYKFDEVHLGDMTTMKPGIGVSNAPGSRIENSGVLLARYEYNGNVTKRFDKYGTLHPHGQSSREINCWVPVKKLLERNDSRSGDWGYSLYMTYMMEIVGRGVKCKSDNGWVVIGGECVIYYKEVE